MYDGALYKLMATPTLQSPPTVPVVLPTTGNATPDYQNWFMGVWNRIGGSNGDLNISNFAYTAPGGVARSLTSKLGDIISIVDYGAVGNGVTDNYLAISRALASGAKHIYVPPGQYFVSKTILINSTEVNLYGAGPGASSLIASRGVGPVIQVNGGSELDYISIKGLMLSHKGIPGSTDHGIQIGPHFNNLILLEDIVVFNNFNGLHLGPTAYSKVSRCFSEVNYGNGIFIGNDANNAPGGQWSILDTLSQLNDGAGLLIQSTGTGNMTCGDVINTSTYANTSGGLVVNGSASCPIHGLRVNNSYFGNDGNLGGIYLNSYAGFTHKITNCYIELCGQGFTGHSVSTPASNIGDGILISANNSNTIISGCVIRGASNSGILAGGGYTAITGCELSYNGQANDNTNGFGIYALSGNVTTAGTSIIYNTQGGVFGSAACSSLNIDSATNISNNSGFQTSTSGMAAGTCLIMSNMTSSLGGILYSTAGGSAILAGNTVATKYFLTETGTGTTGAAPVWSTISSSDISSAALTASNDTNVTLSLGGAPTTALLSAASITAGWSGTLSVARGGTASGTASGARTNLGAAASGANADITSMTGISTTIKAPTAILDTNGNTELTFTAVGSAVNNLAVQNAATTTNPVLAAVGNDTNIGITITAKGTGTNYIESISSTPFGIFSGTGYQHLTNFTFSNTANTRTITFPDSTGTLVLGGGTCSGTCSGTNTGDQTNISGNAATVTTNANLTGPITSSGNATSIASQTGTGTKFVVDTSPTLVTPTLGVASATSINLGDTALSHYKESTWTPTVTLTGGSGNTVPTYTASISGFYTRVGNIVHATVVLSNSAGGTAGAGTGQVNISLPITASANEVGVMPYPMGTAINSATDDLIYGLIGSSATTILLYKASAITTLVALTGADQNNATRTIQLKFTYTV